MTIATRIIRKATGNQYVQISLGPNDRIQDVS